MMYFVSLAKYSFIVIFLVYLLLFILLDLIAMKNSLDN